MAEAYFQALAADDGTPLDPPYPVDSAATVSAACGAAESAFDAYRNTDADARAAFLEVIAAEIIALGDALIERAAVETGLPPARLTGERGRTENQLRLFAEVVRAGRWRGLRIDTPVRDRKPLPRPDLRQRMIPLGPVAVFGASNFPLAFSTAGGDTASALAAGCPVIVKGHPAHPGTDTMVAGAIRVAARRTSMPDGVFGHIRGPHNALGERLVTDPRIAAVGFTGSRAGGHALMRLAQARPVPIPVYAEMSSINPVIIMPSALRKQGADLGTAFVASLTQGAGQFCTNPGLVLAIDGPGMRDFFDAATAALSAHTPASMLTRAIHDSYVRGTAALAGKTDVAEVAAGMVGNGVTRGQARLFATSATAFLADPALGDEVFGAASLVVQCADMDEMRAVVEALEGQLTATLHLNADDEAAAASLVPLLERKAGRILANGWPTGVEVSHAMVHGGPYPATSDARSTSVGTLAIARFLRPVCYQDLPPSLLPPELRDGAEGPRLVDGEPA